MLIPFFITSAFAQKKHVLLEEFSTAPCGFCPDGDLIADQLVKDHPQVIWVTHHAGFGTDSMTTPQSVTIANAFTTFAPGGCVDRGDYPIPVYTMPPYIAISRQKWDSVVTAHENDARFGNINLQNTFNAATRMLTCSTDVVFDSVPPAGDMRINLYIVEDHVVGTGPGYDQKNYMNTQVGHPLYGAGDTIKGYIHRRVVRKVLNDAWGVKNAIPSTPLANQKYSYTFENIYLPPAWKDNDLDVVAFASYYNSDAKKRKVLFSNHAAVNASSGTQEASGTGTYNVYPNPASDRVSVEGVPAGTTLVITGVDGRITKETVTGIGGSVDVSELTPGIYYLRISSGRNSAGVKKLVIAR